jgi:pyrrolidone-carboxylate peptidase
MRTAIALLATSLVIGCAAERAEEADDEMTIDRDAVVIDTSDPAARAQYDANVKFATNYVARCKKTVGRPRVMVTGFGRFLDNETNATGELVSSLVGAKYPRTSRPEGVDDPAPQTAVTQKTISVASVGAVDVCAMVVPVFWDLAAVLAIKEIESFAPELVVMNGIAGSVQPIYLELGGVNRAMTLEDGSDVLKPQPTVGASYAKLVPSAAASDEKRSNVLSWSAVKTSALKAIAAHKNDVQSGRTFSEILGGVELAGFPRGGNTYLCNNLAYVVGYAMAYPNRTLTLMQASIPLAGRINRVRVRITRDLRAVPRVFIHWPSALTGSHIPAAADVLRSAMAGQILATRAGDRPTPGTNDRAEILPEGDTF